MPIHSYENKRGGHTVELRTDQGNLISQQDMTPDEHETFLQWADLFGYDEAYHEFYGLQFNEEAA